ncbi:MAG: radical SAM family heme chaperone HemW [Bacteroidaceae bacterium]|nr:radical SAM family heme chaperone HemW [Bacteroidaceae bacterium]
MAGIYIHVPFCKSRCAYCDFFSTTSGEAWMRRYADALVREMAARRAEWTLPKVDTLYLGGGTPSCLPAELVLQILRSAAALYPLSDNAEVTIEANPDDVTDDWLRALGAAPINRISMGVQTFDDALLALIHRRHSSRQAVSAVDACRERGLHNISLDLIYGLPDQTLAMWESDVRKALSMPIAHLSAYALTYEEGTPLARMRDNNKVAEADEELMSEMYQRLCTMAAEAGMQHYEISNFALPGCQSRHNSSYWQGEPYLGFGPGAHSYDGHRTRRWNLPDLARYVAEAEVPMEYEVLSDDELYDEYIMTRMRTRRGADLSSLPDNRREYCLSMARPHLANGRLRREGNCLVLTQEGLFVSNDIISDLMC